MNKHAAWVSGGYWPVLAACSGSPGPEARKAIPWLWRSRQLRLERLL